MGRSARAGKIGKSLVFLTRKEDAYVDFLKLKKVPLRDLPDDEVCRPPSMEDDNEAGQPNKSIKQTSNDSCSKSVQEKRVIKSSVSNAVVVDVLPTIRKMVLKDRDILEKGTKAYTS